MDETKSANAENGGSDDWQRVVAAVSSIALLAASLYLGLLALLGISDVRRFEFDGAYGRDPYTYAAVTTMAAVSAALFGLGLAWYAATVRPVRSGRLLIAAILITALVLYIAAHSPADLKGLEDMS